MSSINLFDTFGNELTYEVAQNTLRQYLSNSTVNFPLPEASAEILGNLLSSSDKINPTELEMVTSNLISIGYGEPAAKTMAQLLIKIGSQQGVSPLSYFEQGAEALKFTIDAYEAMNALRPSGNRVGYTTPVVNAKSRYGKLIKP